MTCPFSIMLDPITFQTVILKIEFDDDMHVNKVRYTGEITPTMNDGFHHSFWVNGIELFDFRRDPYPTPEEKMWLKLKYGGEWL